MLLVTAFQLAIDILYSQYLFVESPGAKGAIKSIPSVFVDVFKPNVLPRNGVENTDPFAVPPYATIAADAPDLETIRVFKKLELLKEASVSGDVCVGWGVQVERYLWSLGVERISE